jgi:hypothetical protein
VNIAETLLTWVKTQSMKAKVVSFISIHRKVYLVLLLLSLSVTCSRHHAIVPFWCMLKYEITYKIISFKLMGHAYLHKKVTWHLYFSLKKILHNFASTKKDHTLSHKKWQHMHGQYKFSYSDNIKHKSAYALFRLKSISWGSEKGMQDLYAY